MNACLKLEKLEKEGKKRNQCNEKSIVMGMVAEIDEMWANRWKKSINVNGLNSPITSQKLSK